MLARFSAGVYGGLAGGVAVGVVEALVLFSTAARAAEYQALFAAVVLYGAVGLLGGATLGALLALSGRVWALSPAGAYTLSAWGVGAALSAQALALFAGARWGEAVPGGARAAGLALLGVQALLVCWLGPILLTRTPLKILLRLRGSVAAALAALVVSAIFSFAPGRHVSSGGLAAAGQGGRLADRPDLLLVVVHGLRADRDLAAADRLLAAGATSYPRAKSQGASSATAMASLWSSAWPSSHGVLEPGDRLPAEAETLFEVLAEQGYATAAVVGGPHLTRGAGFDQGVRWFRQVGLGGLAESTSLLSLVRRLREEAAAPLGAGLGEARRFIEAQGEDRWFVAVHVRGLSPEGYDRRLAAIDAALDAFLAEREAAPRWEDTVVVLTADHGMELGDHGGEGVGATLYEELLHVPLVVRWPEGEGGEVGSLVRLVDVAPTLAVLGGAVPAPAWQGEVLPRRDDGGDRVQFAELSRHGVSLSSVQRGDWKLIRGLGRTELYELGLDPEEERDRAGEAGAVQAELEQELVRRLKAASRQAVGASASEVDRVTRERLRALGYLR